MRHSARKVIGWLLLVLVVLPLLYGALIGVGVTQGALSPQILADLPKQLVERLPDLVERSFIEAQKPDSIQDPEAQIWVEAAAEMEVTPKEMLVASGILPYLEEELTVAFTDLGLMLRGQKPAQDIVINLRPVKEGLRSQAFESYLRNLFENLPQCTRTETAQWIVALEQDQKEADIPACQPDEETVEAIITRVQTAPDMPDVLPLTEGLNGAPGVFGPTSVLATMAPVLFLIPVLFLVLGVILVADSAKSRLRLAGILVITGAGLALLTALLVQRSVYIAMTTSPSWTLTMDSQFSPEFEQYLIDQFAPVVIPMVKTLFDPVVDLSILLLVLGMIVLGLSLFIQTPASQGVDRTVTQPPPLPKPRKKVASKSKRTRASQSKKK